MPPNARCAASGWAARTTCSSARTPVASAPRRCTAWWRAPSSTGWTRPHRRSSDQPHRGAAAVEHRPAQRRTATTGSVDMATKVQRIKAAPKILQLHIELRGTKPKVWRRVLVPQTITLAQLHLVIQAAFGWGHAHLHEFIAGEGERYGALDPDYDDPASVSSESTRLPPPCADPRCAMSTTSGTIGTTASRSRRRCRPTRCSRSRSALAGPAQRPRKTAAA